VIPKIRSPSPYFFALDSFALAAASAFSRGFPLLGGIYSCVNCGGDSNNCVCVVQQTPTATKKHFFKKKEYLEETKTEKACVLKFLLHVKRVLLHALMSKMHAITCI
jgi:hypothetical protein